MHSNIALCIVVHSAGLYCTMRLKGWTSGSNKADERPLHWPKEVGWGLTEEEADISIRRPGQLPPVSASQIIISVAYFYWKMTSV